MHNWIQIYNKSDRSFLIAQPGFSPFITKLKILPVEQNINTIQDSIWGKE